MQTLTDLVDQVLTILEENKEAFGDRDYLKICNMMREIRNRVTPVTPTATVQFPDGRVQHYEGKQGIEQLVMDMKKSTKAIIERLNERAAAEEAVREAEASVEREEARARAAREAMREANRMVREARRRY